MVVAVRAARGEGVAEPVAAFERNGVGGVGKARGALVGGHHQIGVVAVAAAHVRRRQHDVAVEIVGDVEQGRDEDLVAGGAFAQHGLAVGAERDLPRHERALGADRHDDGVLDLLRLDQAEHFGAEILGPVGPAQAAAGDGAEAQMQALDARRIDEDLAERSRRGQAVDLGAVELDGERRAALAVAVALEGIGAHRGVDQIEDAPDDAVLVQRLRGLERGGDGLARLGDGAFAVAGKAEVELGVEQRHQCGGDVGVQVEDLDQIGARPADADLAQIADEGAQDGDVVPGEPGAEDQLVEPVAFGLGLPDGEDARFDQRRARGTELLGALDGAVEHHVVQVAHRAARGGDGIGAAPR